MTQASSAASKRQRLPWWRPRRSRWAQYVALVVVTVTLVVGGVWLSRTYQRVIDYPDRPGVGSAEPIALEVAKGASFPQVLAQLLEAGVIPDDEGLYFKLFVLHAARPARSPPARTPSAPT
ncbi:hypothetical protein OV079_34865 [Nannocystis pusilla]|uniref:Uncharacterized protein n=1 Tax=Nannocystis pusilla TaxID=889268 RepID=A0A9X3J129_9BACT|nr:hypothetical protein [Nannocystis pusilla]